jgi:hypothetical protein
LSTLRSETTTAAPRSGPFFGAIAIVSIPPLLRSSSTGNGKAICPWGRALANPG